jgi:transposase-like protein
VQPEIVTTDQASTYPPAWLAIVPEAEHITGKQEQQDIERDHQHRKGRIHCMRGFQQPRCAQVICEGHAFLRTLQMGFYRLAVLTGTPRVGQPPRLVRAWDELTARLRAA